MTPFGDVLLWRASEEVSSVWASTIESHGSANSFSANNVQFDWNAGFRIGLTHARGEQSWDTKICWTRFSTSDGAAISSDDPAIIPEFFSGFVSGDTALFDRASLNWDFMFNNIDFELGRTLRAGYGISVRPFLGLKAAMIQQEIEANWAIEALNVKAIECVDHGFRGFGPSFGVDGRWEVSGRERLSIVGSFSGAILWGVWNVDDAYERTDDAPPLFAYDAFTTSMHDSSLGSLNLNYFFGLEWIREGDLTITGRFGYELQWWANQQRLTTFQQLPMHGDLTLEGLTCGITVGF